MTEVDPTFWWLLGVAAVCYTAGWATARWRYWAEARARREFVRTHRYLRGELDRGGITFNEYQRRRDEAEAGYLRKLATL